MPIRVFISDWPRTAQSLVLLLWSLLCDLGLHCSIGLWVRVCRQGQWSEADERERERKRGRERVVISKGFGVVFCSKPVHWMMAGTAECLPMAQLFANLSPPYPPPPIGLRCTLPARTTPIPSASLLKNNSDLIWLSPSYCQGPSERCKTWQSET